MTKYGPNRDACEGVTPRHVPLGVDSCGYFHHHATRDGLIWVFDKANLMRVIDLTNDPGDWVDWVAAVDQERGWDDLSLVAGIAYTLSRGRYQAGRRESDL